MTKTESLFCKKCGMTVFDPKHTINVTYVKSTAKTKEMPDGALLGHSSCFADKHFGRDLTAKEKIEVVRNGKYIARCVYCQCIMTVEERPNPNL